MWRRRLRIKVSRSSLGRRSRPWPPLVEEEAACREVVGRRCAGKEAAYQSPPIVAREEVVPSAAGEEAAAGQGGSHVSGQKQENYRLLPLHNNNLYQLQI